MTKKTTQVALGVIVGMLLGAQAAHAQEDWDRAQEEIEAETNQQHNQEVTTIAANREGVIKTLAQQWAGASGESVDVLEQTFGAQGNEQLLAIQNAKQFDQVRLIVLGQDPDDSAFLKTLEATAVEPLALGDTDKDFVYTPVNPCRVVDTRNAVGPFTPGFTRNYNVYGAVAGQGGNPAGCPSPRGEPRAVHINVTIVPFGGGGNGFVQVWPFGGAVANASLVNFRTGDQNIANAGTVKTGFLLGPEISVKVNGAAAHVIIDVLGYYHEVDANDLVAIEAKQGGYDYRQTVDDVPPVGVDSIVNSTTFTNHFQRGQSGNTTLTVDGDEDVLVTCAAQVFKSDAATPNNIEGTFKICYKNTTTNVVTIASGFNSETDFCFTSTGLPDQRSVYVSSLLTDVPAGTYQFGFCARKGSTFGCYTDEVDYRIAAHKINVIKLSN